MFQSSLSSILTHLGAFLLGAGTGLLAISRYAFRENNFTSNIDPQETQGCLDCREKKECLTQRPTLELTVPEIADLNPPHLGVYQYLNLDATHRLVLYPTMLRLNPPSRFLMTKFQVQETMQTQETQTQNQVNQEPTQTQETQDAPVTLNIAEPSVLPESEKPEVNVPNAGPSLTNMTESQSGNSANFAANYSGDVQPPNILPTAQSSEFREPQTQENSAQETLAQEHIAQETRAQENTIVLLAQLKEGQT